MMVTVAQIQQAASKYVDSEFTSKISGLQKWIFGGMAGLYISSLPSTISKYESSLKSLGIMTEDGMINIDKMYKVLMDEASKTSEVYQHLPLLNDVKFTKSDIEKLYHYITPVGGSNGTYE